MFFWTERDYNKTFVHAYFSTVWLSGCISLLKTSYFIYLKNIWRQFSNFVFHPLSEICEVCISAGQDDVPVEPGLSVRVTLRDGMYNGLGKSTLENRFNTFKRFVKYNRK